MLSKPLKAGPSSGPDGDPASRSVVTTHGCGRRLPAPPTERLRKTPSVNGNGMEHNRNIYVRQAHNAAEWVSLKIILVGPEAQFVYSIARIISS